MATKFIAPQSALTPNDFFGTRTIQQGTRAFPLKTNLPMPPKLFA
jgi:hypothetical protein